MRRVGFERAPLGSDIYHLLRTATWTQLFLALTVLFVASNCAFTLLYLAGGDCVHNAKAGSFEEYFFFSVETMATIGYGYFYPQTEYAHFIVTLESVFGLLLTAFVTGIAFSKFSTPTARVLFSHKALFRRQDGVQTVTFRLANGRLNTIVDAQITVNVMLDDVRPDGTYMRRIHDVALRRSKSPIFSLSFLAVHVVDENSPIAGETEASLIEKEAMFVVSVSGLDETLMQTVHARHVYRAADLVWNAEWHDVLHTDEDGEDYIDYREFQKYRSVDPT